MSIGILHNIYMLKLGYIDYEIKGIKLIKECPYMHLNGYFRRVSFSNDIILRG